ncbi:MAG TPA: hypothetical protein ENK95_02110 [Campylobacterales bacterium]|nr:hypothetical protein [Campylobacterales bacterium]
MAIPIFKITLLTLVTLFFTACMPKQNGQYKTKYSYHPYYDLYDKKVISDERKNTKIANVSKPKTKKSTNPFNTVDFYPSNVPAKR